MTDIKEREMRKIQFHLSNFESNKSDEHNKQSYDDVVKFCIQSAVGAQQRKLLPSLRKSWKATSRRWHLSWTLKNNKNFCRYRRELQAKGAWWTMPNKYIQEVLLFYGRRYIVCQGKRQKIRFIRLPPAVGMKLFLWRDTTLTWDCLSKPTVNEIGPLEVEP